MDESIIRDHTALHAEVERLNRILENRKKSEDALQDLFYKASENVGVLERVNLEYAHQILQLKAKLYDLTTGADDDDPTDSSRETRNHNCPFCGKQWLEYCDDDNYPDYCPGCGEELREPGYDPNESCGNPCGNCGTCRPA